MRRLLFVTCVLLAVAAVVSCGRRYHLSRDEISGDTIWPFARGDLSARGVLEQGGFCGRLDILWEAKSRGRPTGPLTIYNNTLICPETKKKIRFYDVNTGKVLGRIKTKGVPQSSVAVADSVAFFALAPRRNSLLAFDLLRYKSLWTHRVKDATAGPIIVNDRLLVGSREGTLAAYALADGHHVWKFESELRLTASASYSDGRVFQPADRGTLYVLSAGDGRELYRVSLKGPVVSEVAIAEYAYVTDMLGHVYALKPEDGTVVWEKQLDGPIWTSPAVAHRHVYVGHSGGEVVALDAADGEELWSYRTVEVVRASPVVIGDYVVVGTMAGRVFVLRADDGTLVESKKLVGAVAFPPVTDGERLFVATQAGRVVCFGENNEYLSHADQGVDPQHEPE